jgi:hypothetical protein
VGAYDDEMSDPGSFPHTSSCACSGKRASCHACTATTPSTHALDGHAVATVICTSKNVGGSTSSPPQRVGWSIRKKPASRKSAIVSSGTRRSSSAFAALAASVSLRT